MNIQITEYTSTASALAELRGKYDKVLFPVDTTAGMKDAKAARSELRDIRVGLEKMRAEIKAPALERCRLIDSEAKAITAVLTALEDPIDAQIKAQEQKLAAEKAERERKEAERKAGLQAKVDAIRNIALSMDGETLAEIQVEIAVLRNFVPGEEFMEFADAASEAAQAAIVSLTALHDRQAVKEAEAAELERQRAENARIAAEQEAERKRLAAVAAEQAAAIKAEQDRIAAEQADRDRMMAENQRAFAEQQQEFMRVQQEAFAKMEADRAALQADRDALEAKKLADEEAEAKKLIASTPAMASDMAELPAADTIEQTVIGLPESVAEEFADVTQFIPLQISYDEADDVLTVEGIQYAGDMFRQFGGMLPIGEAFEIAARTDGVLTVKTIMGAA